MGQADNAIMETLKNKVVLITGSSIGIGREDAFRFSQAGCRVAITYYKDREDAEKTAKKCIDLGAADAFVVYLNVMDDASIKSAVKQVVDRFGEISILINNAGVIIWRRLEEQEFDDIAGQIRTNLEGLIKVTKECLPFVQDTIINMASGAGLTGYVDLTVYCATKWGVRGFTKSLAEELPKIKVYAVNPGAIATRMTDFRGMPPEKVAEVVFNLASGKYRLKSGSDVNIWDYVR
jgi:NAD(P)-dependent dehydrogenase (short-subunit alcohol dehydrogenase family)